MNPKKIKQVDGAKKEFFYNLEIDRSGPHELVPTRKLGSED